jgi:hypothetical protein
LVVSPQTGRWKVKMPSPEQTTPDTPLRLSVVAALAFPEDPRRKLVCVTARQESTERPHSTGTNHDRRPGSRVVNRDNKNSVL